MIGKALTFAAQRLASRAVDSVERRLVWGGFSGLLIVSALVFGLMSLFVYLQSTFGTMQAALALTGGCAALAFLFAWMPSILEWIEDMAEEDETVAESLAEAVDEDAQEAVDTFGPLQVAVSSFMLGLSAARSLKGRARG